MNEFSQLSTASVTPVDRGRGLRYLVGGLTANSVLWGITWLLLQEAPRLYTSQWSFILTEGGAAAIRAPQGANSAVLDRPSEEMRATYREIATTSEVRKAAAAKLGMTTSQFGKPNVRVVAGTTLIEFEITGSTPDDAQKKAYALKEAFQERLTQLRVQQISEQESGFESSLAVARKKLEAAQLRLADYKAKSGLASTEQLDQLASNIEALRRVRAEVMAQQQDAGVRARQLSTELKLPTQIAVEALTLRSDSLFQQYQQEYSESTAALTAISAKFGPNHPVVIRETARQKAATDALQARGQAVLGHPIDLTAIARFNSASNPATTAQETLFNNVVTSHIEQQGLAARVAEIDRQLAQLEKRLSVLAQRNSTLEALSQDSRVAESIFSSTLANLNADRAGSSSSYPPVQLATEPNLPEAASVPSRKPLLLGATIGSLVLTAGLFLLWLRKTALLRKWFP